MIPPGTRIERANWKITAVALRCDYLGEFVTSGLTETGWRSLPGI